MKAKWFVTLFAVVPLAAALISVSSCGGEGGPTSGNGGGLPGVTEQFLALLTPAQKNASYIGADACGTCHNGRAEGGEQIFAHWQETKHASVGVTCERCHGPGSAHQANPSAENILTSPKSLSAVVCAQCHGKTYDEWQASAHSKLLQSPVEEAVNNPDRYGRTNRCVACHSNIFRVENDKGVDLGSLTDEEIIKLADETLTESPHTATCATCHNPHAQTKNLTDNGKEAQLRHAVFSTDTTTVGAGSRPADFTKFNHICAQCHNGRGANPADQALQNGTARPNMHDSNQYNMLLGFGGVEGGGPVKRNTAHSQAPGQCSKCHMPDSRHTFTVSYDKGCNPCHTPADAAARATSTRDDVIGQLFALKNRMEAYAQANYGDADLWDYTSVITAEGKTPPDQNLVPIELKRARHNYYFVVRSGDYGVHNAPYAKHLIQVANDNLDSVNVGRPQKKGVSVAQMRKVIEETRARSNRADAKGF
ncbi:MAG: cytochrome c3 family protein [Fimbriimonadaceae bacterium]|nr:cytochrome c3 family protein [Fimbriimonadaceae bacterium]QYK55062.1 MAG: cytochrome c3 family protein [Fimbriimonadaceae bacterium]